MADRGIPKPSTTEDEYFVREDAEKKRSIAHAVRKAMAEEQQRSMKELHYMHCPRCGMEMRHAQHGDLDVDDCAHCGGVYLAKGELDAIVRPDPAGFVSAVLNWFKDETQRPVR